MYFLFVLAFTADAQAKKTAARRAEMQDALMRVFFTNITPEGKAELSKNRPAGSNYHDWKGFSCKNGQISVYYHMKDIGNFNIEFLPHSTENILIACCRQKYAIETRLLPRGLIVSVQLSVRYRRLDCSTMRFGRIYRLRK